MSRADERADAALTAASRHPDVARLARALAARPGTHAVVSPHDPVPRRAAVAVVLRVAGIEMAGDGPVELLFIKRAEFAGDPWSGQIAFPGGRHEPQDASLLETATRETREELGLDLALDARLLGTLDDLHPRTPVLPPILVRPYVFVAAPSAPLAPSHEVALAFWIPLAALAAPGASVTSTVRPRGADMLVPSVVHEGHTIWGMTERMLRQLLARFAEAV
jgi:8-oxo-dGTP pyrophosphatase MutT (NUDIX family)